MCDHKFQQVGAEELVPGVEAWRCESCGKTLIAAENFEAQVNRADLAVAVASNLLWDFHERAVAKYGPETTNALTSMMKQPGDPRPAECDGGHHYASGECIHCGTTMFLDGR